MKSAVLLLLVATTGCAGRTTESAVDTGTAGGDDARRNDDAAADTPDAADTADGSIVDASGAVDDTLPDASRLDTPADAPRSLLDVPLFAGPMAFNELNNDGFSGDVIVRWSSADLVVSSTGHVSARVVTTYGGPAVTSEAKQDVLFWNTVALYVMSGESGDLVHDPLSETSGVVASTSDSTSATFALDGDFPLPAMSKFSGTLADVYVQLTWVRVYRTAGKISYHVFPGRPSATDPAVRLSWDHAPPSASARFGYYAPIAAAAVGGGSFDYAAWCTTHLSW